MMFEKNQPIVAVATAPGVGAVGILRVSGPDLDSFVTQLTGKTLNPRSASLCQIKDAQGLSIDQVVCIYFKAPNSYTGEDVLEIQGHGGPVILNMLVERCLQIGRVNNDLNYSQSLRLARPGEFTERAFLNSKLDLAQAEAVMDLISASTKLAAQSAVRSLQGQFSNDVNVLKNKLIHLRVLVEASIDFPEEEIDFIKSEQAINQIDEINEELNLILKKSEQGRVLQQGVNAVIAGQPNAGKSSLMNALAAEEVAIVTSIAGTTRDVISENVSINGVPFRISDTAGLRDNISDEVEQLGIERAWSRIEQADLIIFLHDLTRQGQQEYDNKEKQIFDALLGKGIEREKIIHVYNKADLTNTESKPREFSFEVNSVQISAKKGQGIEDLKQQLLLTAGWSENNAEGVYLSRQRHLIALRKTQENVQNTWYWMQGKEPALELIAEELRLAQNHLSEITGEFSSDDLLGEIFSNFCIGK
jgi:tRNA modification GTPase